ncbi:hypothetical protein HPB50_014860 [Hyalomma asiaticum]|uniref:Uncharacterized protein n=1 Tax=Hyalomma asiaticum TaxID=266040 RepID=A0ACB7SYD6_HYAAI|nr:hypothetical protein HPB50_014860 [Hyalomma asiaticum]
MDRDARQVVTRPTYPRESACESLDNGLNVASAFSMVVRTRATGSCFRDTERLMVSAPASLLCRPSTPEGLNHQREYASPESCELGQPESPTVSSVVNAPYSLQRDDTNITNVMCFERVDNEQNWTL